jgi:hypothetical protein
MKHMPYENGGGTRAWTKKGWLVKEGHHHSTVASMKFCRRHVLYYDGLCPECHQERPECPIDEVIQTTEEAWEKRDLNISGDRREEK